MSEQALVDAALLFAVATISTFALVALAPKIGLVDDASDARDRKHHVRAVPLVGGAVIALCLIAWVSVRGVDVVGGALSHRIAFTPVAVLASAVLAFATGFIDDVLARGLGPLAKFSGQTAAGIALATGLQIDAAAAPWWAGALAVLAAIVAQNAANTFDNADGALTAVSTAGFACAAPIALFAASSVTAAAPSPLVGATLAFLPWCMLRAQGSTTPRAWLGDSGSHLLGILLLTTPIAWAALVLPLADLLRVIVVRLRAGDPIWVGDRRHLAHELETRGLSVGRVVCVLVLLSAPALICVRIARG